MSLGLVQKRRPLWLEGAIITLIAIGLVEVLRLSNVNLPSPGPLLLALIAICTFMSGGVGGVVGFVLVVGYAALRYSEPGSLFHYSAENHSKLLTLLVLAPVVGFVAWTLRLRAARDQRTAVTRERARGLADLEASRDLSKQRVTELLDGVPAIVWELHAKPGQREFRVAFVSAYAERLLGYPLTRWMKEPDFWLDVIRPKDRERVQRAFAEMIARESGRTIQFRVVNSAGQTSWLETSCSIIRGENNVIEGLRNVSIDVTQRKRAYNALRRRAAALISAAHQLKQTNAELDQFAYITSHDLRAPLRGIANLSSWIEEDMGERFTPEAHQQMELLRGRVHRMEALIDGILQYSRVGRVSIPVDEVDVGKLVREVIDLLAPPENVTIEIKSSLPTIRTEKLRMQQVFMNLIGNAIKHSARPDARIKITCRDVGAFYAFGIQDNGPGIAPQYHEKIFVMFQTLQARDKVEGTGVGLSLVRKIVEHLGGQISVDSREGEGAIFRFTWPKEPTNHEHRAATKHSSRRG